MWRYESFDGKRHESIVSTAVRFYRCDYDGKLYDFAVNAEQQEACPKWDPEKEANPPLPAAKALAKSNEFIATINAKEGFWWELVELNLGRIIDGWMWQAWYRLTKKGINPSVPVHMPCWILMDGTVIQPRITEDTK